jgi:hypothetical protein
MNSVSPDTFQIPFRYMGQALRVKPEDAKKPKHRAKTNAAAKKKSARK